MIYLGGFIKQEVSEYAVVEGLGHTLHTVHIDREKMMAEYLWDSMWSNLLMRLHQPVCGALL